MSKVLKKYNKETKQWEIISDSIVNVDNIIYNGEELNDNNIGVTNPFYNNDSASTLNDALSCIGSDIAELQRNVSWLAEHGGGGGGNGGGGGGGGGGDTPAGYGIYVTYPTLENNSVYISTTEVIVKFMITGGTQGDEVCQYRYTYDDTYTSQYIGCKLNEVITIKIDNINMVSNNTTHTMSINAVNSEGTTIPPVSFKIYESSLNIALSKTKNEISNNEVLMSRNNKNGLIYFDIKNGLMGSDTVIKYTCNSVEYTVPAYKNEKVNNTMPINIWEVIGNNVNVNDLYNVSITIQATLGSVMNKTPELFFNVRITDPNEFTIYFDGLTYLEDVESEISTPTEVEQSDRLKFTFKASLPVIITNKNIYYAIDIISEDESFHEFIEGTSFSDKIEEVYKQKMGNAGINITAPQYPLNNLAVDQRYIIRIKAWTYDGGLSVMREGSIVVVASNNEIYPRQHNKRYDIIAPHLSADTCLCAWSYSAPMTNGKWLSSQKYVTMQNNDETIVNAEVIPYNINGIDSGFISSAEIPYLRLQNEAYAMADVSKLQSELIFMVHDQYSEGFTISLTFKCDEYSDTSKVVCLFGENTADMNLASGIKVTLETIYWYLSSAGKTYLLKAFIRQNVKNTVDFVYQPTIKKSVDINGNETEVPDGFAYIYVNGIVNAVYNIGVLDSTYKFSDTVYFGCDHYNGTLSNYSDVNIYEFAIYTKALNPLQIVVNKKNAQLIGAINNENTIKDYQEWKRKNLIYNEDYNTEKALSYLIDRETGDFKYQSYNELRANSPIPIIRIDANQAKDFTEAYFHADYSNDKAVTGRTHSCLMYYYDPVVRKEVEFNTLIALQGTSTLGYYIKNLEIIVDEVCSDDPSKTQLFQPREDWFPEKEFTLKADIVDSSHANNATIGYWINNISGLMEKNPAMNAMTDEYRPKDKIMYKGQEKIFKHISTIDNRTEIDFDEKVTLKHNLEGFPVIVLIKFSDKNDYDLVGVYSFNLGRYSYYNMGLSFLKAFSRRRVSENPLEESCPALVDYYEEYSRNERFGGDSGVLPNQIFSYEFGASADDNTLEHQTWTQADISILKHYGDFNFNGEQIGENAPESIWSALSNLFNITATMYGKDLSSWDLTGKYVYTYQNGAFLKTNNRYPETPDNMSVFNDYISVNNAVAYFIIASSFGMIDSLGKNLTIRTWDGGKKWWTCFYDMDTALGLSNEGAENIPEDVFVDRFKNITEIGKETVMQVLYHTKEDSGYNAYYSKLWAILRDSDFLYNYTGSRENKLYENTWTQLRRTGGPFDSHMNFVNLMTEHIGMCGELLYNYDYNSKYIINSSNLSMLHGLRIEFVRSWLKNRFYFLDGVFENKTIAATYLDSPFYTNAFNVTNEGHPKTQIGYIPYTFKSTAPIFIKVNTGNVGQTDFETQGKYFLPKNTVTTINTPEHTSRKQTNFTSSSVLTQFEGLNGIGVVNMNTNNSPRFNVLPELVNFNIAGTTSLDALPIDFQKVFMYKDETTKEPNGKITGPSCLESLTLTSTKVVNDGEYPIDLKSFTKIKNIDISSSNVTSLVLPNSTLHTLRINGSYLREFNMSNQPLLKTIDFTGCNKLTSVNIVNCESLEELVFDNMLVLQTINLQSCKGLKKLTVKKCDSLVTLMVADAPQLSTINLNYLTNPSLSITLPIDNVNTLSINTIVTKNPLVLSYNNENSFKQLTSLTINNWPFLPKIIYKNGQNIIPDETYCLYEYTKEGKQYQVKGSKLIPEDATNVTLLSGSETEDIVFDFSKFTSLKASSVILSGIKTIKYLRLPEPSGTYYDILENAINLTEIVRMFGSYRIIKANFNNRKGFYLNEPEAYSDYNKDLEIEGVEYVDVQTNPYFTNLKIDTNDLSGKFSTTSLSYDDVIYIMKQCSKVTNLNSTFSNTNFIIDHTKIMPVNLFKWCENVTSIDKLFSGCQVRCFLPNGLLEPLKKITTFNNVFESGSVESDSEGDIEGTMVTYSYGIDYSIPFFPEGNKITEIKGFSPVAIYEDDVNLLEAYADTGLTYFYANKLLKNLDELVTIEESFNLCAIDFRKNNGAKLFTNTPKLKNIINSFLEINGETGNPGLDSEGNPYVDDVFGAESIEFISIAFSFHKDSNMYIYFGDNFFNNIKDTISYIGCGYTTDGPNAEIVPNISDAGSFLSGFVNKLINTKTCKDGVFPYDILKECINLTEINGLFKGLKGDSSIIYDIPKDMFVNNTKLTNISSFFAEMKLNYHLTSESFINNKIVNFNSVFKDNLNQGKCGQIPYRLFYQSGGNYITNLREALRCGTLFDIEHYTCSEENVRKHLTFVDENGLTTINPYLYDGTIEFYDKYIKGGIIEDIYNLYQCIDNSEEIPSNLQKYVNSEGTPLYNPLHEVYINAIKDYAWLKDLKNLIRSDCFMDDNTYEESKCYNYFCPPDIFNYCKNVSTLDLDNVFTCKQNSSTTNTGMTGYRGRIPEHIFDNITNISKLNAIFSGCENIMPHRNGYSTVSLTEDNKQETKYHAGIMYPRGLFDKLTNLKTLSKVFANNYVWGLCVIEPDMFGSVGKNVTSIASLFEGCTFIKLSNHTVEQIESGLFDSFGVLKNISGLFSQCTNIGLTKAIFTNTIHPWLTDVSNFMFATTLISAIEVPEFWTWTYPPEKIGNCYSEVTPIPLNNDSIPELYKMEIL